MPRAARYAAVLALIGLASTGAATEPSPPLEISVEQAVLLALENNRNLAVERLAPEIAGAFADIARSTYDPELYAAASAGRERAIETARSTESRFAVEGRDTDAALGLRQKLPTGGAVDVGISHTMSDSNRTPAQHEARLGVSLTQALLRGIGPAVNLAAVRQAVLETQASRYELRGFAQTLVAETEIAYWRYVLAEREIAIYDESLAVAKKQRDDTEQEIEVGTLPQTEAAAARAEVARREQNLIDARSTLETRRLALLRLLSPPAPDPLGLDVRATSEPSSEGEALGPIEERLALADAGRPDLAEARLRLEERRLETVVTKNGLLPRLDLFVAFGKTGYGDDVESSFRRLRGDTYDVFGGLSFSELLGNRDAAGRHRAAVATRRQAERAIENLRELGHLEVRLAATEVERAQKQIKASAATRALQEQTLLAETTRFKVGDSTTLLVAQAQRDLLESRIAEVEAVVAYRSALVRLYAAEGSLLERRGIEMGDGLLVHAPAQ